MAREGVPAGMIEQKIRRRAPDPESQKPILGYLRDSRDAFEGEGKEETAAILEEVLGRLEAPEETCE